MGVDIVQRLVDGEKSLFETSRGEKFHLEKMLVNYLSETKKKRKSKTFDAVNGCEEGLCSSCRIEGANGLYSICQTLSEFSLQCLSLR